MRSSKATPLSSGGQMVSAATSSPPHDGSLSAGRFVAVVGPCALFCLLVLAIAPWVGSAGIRWQNVVAGHSPDREIFMVARLPRILFGAVVGGALAVAGGLFRTLLLNSLVTPLCFGLLAGCSLRA